MLLHVENVSEVVSKITRKLNVPMAMTLADTLIRRPNLVHRTDKREKEKTKAVCRKFFVSNVTRSAPHKLQGGNWESAYMKTEVE